MANSGFDGYAVVALTSGSVGGRHAAGKRGADEQDIYTGGKRQALVLPGGGEGGIAPGSVGHTTYHTSTPFPQDPFPQGGNPADPASAGAPTGGGPMCSCGLPCEPRTANSAANAGRLYYACPKTRTDPTRCKFFEFADGMNAMGGAVPPGGYERARAMDPTFGDRTINDLKSGAVAADKGTCFSCGQPGHWSRDCLNKGSSRVGSVVGTCGGGWGQGYGGGPGGTPSGSASFGGSGYSCGYGGRSGSAPAGGGGTKGSGTCFSCGQPGHWSRDCPNKGSGGGGGGAVYGGGGSGSWGKGYGGGWGR